MVWAGLALFAVGFAWACYCEWLRHRPYNLERGTQHLAMAGSCGFLLAATVGVILMALAVKGRGR